MKTYPSTTEHKDTQLGALCCVECVGNVSTKNYSFAIISIRI